MLSIIKEIMKKLPEEKVSAAAFEGANIVSLHYGQGILSEQQGTHQEGC